MEENAEPVKKRRGWPKGKPRGPRKANPVAQPMFTPAPEPEAPIHVKLRLKNYSEPVEFGCARRTVENGFHVFFYPSEIDRYRETRREFAVSEIVEIEITEARQVSIEYGANSTVHWLAQPTSSTPPMPTPATTVTVLGPKIHSARQNAASVLGALENSQGPIKMDKMPNLSFGDSEA